MFKDLEEVFLKFGIDFFIVGAVARDYFLSVDAEAVSKRKTDDVDIAIMLSNPKQFNELKEALLETGKFAANETEHIKLYYKNAIELDLLPFGQIENAESKVFLETPNAFRLNMPGFKEIYPFIQDVKLPDDLNLKICPIEGIIILKLLAYNDRPERTKDIDDIEHLIDSYFELCSADVYDEYFDIMELYDTKERRYLSLVSARVVGRKMKKILETSDKLTGTIKAILNKRNEDWTEAILAGLDD